MSVCGVMATKSTTKGYTKRWKILILRRLKYFRVIIFPLEVIWGLLKQILVFAIYTWVWLKILQNIFGQCQIVKLTNEWMWSR